jgi:uncharacterized phage protein (TIGR02218 family)
MPTQRTRSIGSLNLVITGATNASPIVITTSTPHKLKQGQRVTVAGVLGNTAANGDWRVAVGNWTANTFGLVNSNGNGAYTSGGTVTRNYASIAAWNAGEAANLVALDEVRTGEMCFDSSADYFFLFSAALVITGATTDATRYRRLLAPSHYYYSQFPVNALTDPQSDTYDPVTRTGILLDKPVDNTNKDCITISEEFFRLEGLGINMRDGGAGSGAFRGVNVTVQSARVDGVFVRAATIPSTSVTVEGISHGGYVGATTSSLHLKVLNSIVVGGTSNGVGATSGFRSAHEYDRIFNSVAYSCRGGVVGAGFNWSGANAHIRNCVSLDSFAADFIVSGSSTFDHNISGDSTASAGVGSVANQFASQTFLYAQYDDFRLLQSSRALDTGVDLSSTFTSDITGDSRVVPWEIGAYNGYADKITDPPTVEEYTIGSAGRDYATPQAWADAFDDAHLVAQNKIIRGVLYPDSPFSSANPVLITGAVTDKTRYRELVVADGQRYVPKFGTGVFLSSATAADVVRIDEDYFRMSGFGVETLDVAGAGERTCVHVTGDGVIVDGIFGKNATSTAGVRPIFKGTGLLQRFRNCIAVGDSNTVGADVGFHVTGVGSKVQSNNAARIRRGATGTCYKDGGAGGVQFENCIAGSSDVGFNVTAGWQRNNASIDITAGGPGSIISLVAADTWIDADLNDFRLKSAALVINKGIKLSGEFLLDFLGKSRTGSWEMGAIDGFLEPPRFPSLKGRNLHTISPIFSIVRQDGASLNFSSTTCPLVHAGLVFEPSGGISSSTRRNEVALQDQSMEVAGALTSDKITVEDLLAGRYKLARVTERVINHRYPFAEPLLIARFVIRDTEFDGMEWKADLVGLNSMLENEVGMTYGPKCKYRLYSPSPNAQGEAGCGVDRTEHLIEDVEVLTVADSTLEFDAKGSASNFIPGSYADEAFQYGRLVWRTGLNAGLESEIRGYVQATRTVKLFAETPFDIEVGDRFDIEEGCDRVFDSPNGCLKYDNQVNFGGEPFTVGADRALSTPTA